MKSFTGLRVLVVEDDYLIAQIAMDMLEDLGAVALGPCASVQQALDTLLTQSFDAALLDVNLRGEASQAVAQALTDKAIPYVFVTGYGAVRFDQNNTPVLSKPYTLEKLTQILAQVLRD
jgi:CheY-like chemotaxis protein